MARRDAEENIVSGKELDIAACAELVCASSKADQSGTSVDLSKVFTGIGSLNSDGACAIRIQRMGNGRSASATVREGRCGSRIESLDLDVVHSLRDFPALKAIAHMGRDALGEVILQKESIGRTLLAEEIIAVVHNQVSRGAGIVLRTRCRGKRRRTCSGTKYVGIRQQGCAKKVRSHQAPVPGNAETVIPEHVHNAELVGYADSRAQVRGQGNTVRQSAAGKREVAHAVAR